ncbi:uncharacterized protein LOC117328518 [Pecten maximus]|uniref:uncharacterized protein LOC117328518 n=1 Tax=Pecten maximus TaxID=6579 RepID=UPI00145846B5|nr:uncharacterized protein LOC117328518 [Pecten maximus]
MTSHVVTSATSVTYYSALFRINKLSQKTLMFERNGKILFSRKYPEITLKILNHFYRNTMDEQIPRRPASQSLDIHPRKGQHYDTAYDQTTSNGGSNSGTVGATYYNTNTGTDQQFSNTNRYNIGTRTDQQFSYTHGYNFGTGTHQYLQNNNGRKQSPNHDLAAGVVPVCPWYVRETNVADGQNGELGWYMYNQTSVDANNYNRNQTGPSYQTIYDVNNTNGRCDGSYPTLISTAVKGTSHHVNVTWTKSSNDWRNEMGCYGNTTWADNRKGQRIAKPAQGHDALSCDTAHGNVPINGPGTWNNRLLCCECHQHQSCQSQKAKAVLRAEETLGAASRKRKVFGETETTPNTYVTSAPTVDKRALYSKFRVVKKTERSPSCTESSKVTPMLWRSKLGDRSIVDVNYDDGLPINAKMAKTVPTLTPVKENEASASIGNIQFITLENMKVVRRKLEVVLAIQQREERRERLRLEAKVRAKVKVNAKERARKGKKCNDRKRHVEI